jgi:glutathione synthase/RimK-type ligase-like ATP-grasp enzyme
LYALFKIKEGSLIFMSTVYNHSRHFTAEQFISHDTERYYETLDYGGLDSIRALPCSEADDVVQLDPRLKDNYPFIREHWQEAGLDISNNIHWGVDAADLAQYPQMDFSVYHFTPDVHETRPDLKRVLATQDANNKNTFINFCDLRGYPVPKTYMIEPGMTPDLSDIQTPAYIKAAESQAGISILKADTASELEEHVKSFNGKFQVQESVENASFINVQYKALGNRALHLATSEQLLRGYTHIGNKYPTHHDPRDITDSLADNLAEKGLKGIYAFDVAMSSDGDVDNTKIIECNPRWNGASYPTVIGNRLGAETWEALGIRTPHENIGDIDLSGLVYDRAKGYGAVVTGFVFKPNKRIVNVMLAGPKEAQDELRPQVMERLTNTKHDKVSINVPLAQAA